MNAVEFWRLLRPHHRRAVLVGGLVLLDTALASLGVGVVLPLLQAILSDDHRSPVIARLFPAFDAWSPQMRLVAIVAGTLVLFLGKAVIAYKTVASSNRLWQRLRFYWVERIGLYYLCGPFQRIAGRKQGELLNDWFNETLSATRFYQSYLLYISSLVLVIALFVLGFVVDWRAMLAFSVLGAVAAVWVRKTLYARSTKLSETKLQLNQAVSASMVEDLANARDLRLMGAQAARLGHLSELTTALGDIFTAGAIIGEVPRIVSEVATVALLRGMVLIGALVLEMDSAALLPAVAFFAIAAYRLVSAGTQMMGARIKALNEVHSVQRVRDMIAQADDREILEQGVPLAAIETDIALKHLDYGYRADTQVIHDVDVVIPRGKITYLLGPSGAGKSTLLDLLLRLIEPDRGDIEANGRRASEFRLRDWRRAFGYVSQDVSLFNGSLRMNLLLARPGASESELNDACRLAGADTFIGALPGGLDAVVGDRGHSLSGGQRKRVAIARALVARPSVLVLDEATTSFEQSLEQEMLRNLTAALPELTIIQVTHRLASVSSADWVIELERGRVLMCGAYAKR